MFKSYKRDVEKAIEEGIRDGLNLVGLQLQAQASRNITNQGQVDTGRMRASITYVTEDVKGKIASDNKGITHNSDKASGKAPKKSLYIGSNVEYAPQQEKRNSFIKRAVTQQKNNISKLINGAIERSLK